MTTENGLLTFGPVPSRRLGQSLGINNIPPKICTYSCVYCQLGRTLRMQAERQMFYQPERLSEAIERTIKNAGDKKEPVDYLTFVPDGEPTLDANLGNEIELLKSFGINIAVISNASLIWQNDVRDNLSKADWVSMKIDAVSEPVWRKINRPHKSLQLDMILQGIADFSKTFKGQLATETMLIQGINDNAEEMKKVADFIAAFRNVKSYISIPTRPPAEKWVKQASEYNINEAYQIFKENAIDVEYLIGYEGNAFAFTGNIENDLLSITSVHPMRKEAVDAFLEKANGDWRTLNELISQKKIVELKYKGNCFYMRNLKTN